MSHVTMRDVRLALPLGCVMWFPPAHHDNPKPIVVTQPWAYNGALLGLLACTGGKLSGARNELDPIGTPTCLQCRKLWEIHSVLRDALEATRSSE